MNAWNKAEPDALVDAYNELEGAILDIMSSEWENKIAKDTLLNVAQGAQLFVAMLMSKATGEKLGAILKDAEIWLTEFSKLYLKESKEGELKEFVKVMYHQAEKYLK